MWKDEQYAPEMRRIEWICDLADESEVIVFV